jgi:hypothetical protein
MRGREPRPVTALIGLTSSVRSTARRDRKLSQCALARPLTKVQPGRLGHQLGHELPLGGYEYGGKIDQVCYGLIGDVRIVARPLPRVRS